MISKEFVQQIFLLLLLVIKLIETIEKFAINKFNGINSTILVIMMCLVRLNFKFGFFFEYSIVAKAGIIIVYY